LRDRRLSRSLCITDSMPKKPSTKTTQPKAIPRKAATPSGSRTTKGIVPGTGDEGPR